MPTLIADAEMEAELRQQREVSGADRFDEVWDGVYVMSPLADYEHQEFVTQLAAILQQVVGWPGLGTVLAGVNVSDRDTGWKRNYRIPDIAVYLNTNSARNLRTHVVGGPDLAVEITSAGDLTRDKIPFYASTGTRELVLLDRETWTLELHRLDPASCSLTLTAGSTAGDSQALTSETTGLIFRLLLGPDRPRVEVTDPASSGRWLI